MRILHLIHSEGVYGAERILLYLAGEQQHRGHQPLIGSIRDPGTPETPFEALARAHGLTVVRIRIAPRPTPGVVKSLLGSVRAVAPDVLHSHGYKANILLGPVPRGRRGPMLATLHGWTSTRLFSRMWVYEHLDRLALRRLDGVVVVARSMLKLRPLRGVAASRRHVIENGIPPLAARLHEMAAHGAAPLPDELVEFVAHRPTFIAMGRLSLEKGFELLLEAFARVRAQTAATHQLLVVGEGPQHQLLENRIAAFGLSAEVRLAGYVDGADRLLEHAAGFVMSSLTEGMPLVLLEALQWRVPILATAVGAIPDILEGGRRGLLAPPGDVDALATGLLRILELRPVKPASKADEATADPYTSAGMAERYLGAYAAICEQRS